MSFCQWLTKKTPLNDERDIMARVGVRCAWFTLPYFVSALSMAAFGEMKPLLTPVSAVMLIVPIGGGILDSYRVHRRRVNPTAV